MTLVFPRPPLAGSDPPPPPPHHHHHHCSCDCQCILPPAKDEQADASFEADASFTLHVTIVITGLGCAVKRGHVYLDNTNLRGYLCFSLKQQNSNCSSVAASASALHLLRQPRNRQHAVLRIIKHLPPRAVPIGPSPSLRQHHALLRCQCFSEQQRRPLLLVSG